MIIADFDVGHTPDGRYCYNDYKAGSSQYNEPALLGEGWSLPTTLAALW